MKRFVQARVNGESNFDSLVWSPSQQVKRVLKYEDIIPEPDAHSKREALQQLQHDVGYLELPNDVGDLAAMASSPDGLREDC